MIPTYIQFMCGRFVSSSSPEKIAGYFDVDHVDEETLDRSPKNVGIGWDPHVGVLRDQKPSVARRRPGTAASSTYIDARTKNLKNQHWFVTHVPASQVFDGPTC